MKAKVRSRENSCDIADTRLMVKAAKVATDPDTSARTYRCGLVGRGLRCTTFTGTPPVAIEARSVARTSMRSVRLRRLRMTVVASLCWIGIITRWISASCARFARERSMSAVSGWRSVLATASAPRSATSSSLMDLRT